MNVPTITMDREEAELRRAEYWQARKRRAAADLKAEWSQLEHAYAALAEGTPVVDVEQAFAEVPCDAQGRPRLAIARADRKQVRFRWDDWRLWTFDTRAAFMGPRSETLLFDVRSPRPRQEYVTGYALVPLIPPRALPAGGCALSRHFILWEVEAWADREIGAKPDVDPLLLRPLHGSLYAVVAQWDLTEIEQRILAGRVVRS